MTLNLFAQTSGTNEELVWHATPEAFVLTDQKNK